MLRLVDGEALGVENCAREPIHIPDTIQPFGCLLAGPPSLTSIEYAGANLMEIIGREAQDVLGLEFSEVLPEAAIHEVRNLLSYATARQQRERVGRYEINGYDLEVYAHIGPTDHAVIELERRDMQDEATGRAPVERARQFLARASVEQTIERMLAVSVIGLRDLTGFDRVKAYRYADDGSGEVIAEARGADVESFLGLRYPSWDVPEQARALQVKNPLRMISNIDQDPVPLLSYREKADPLDMSFSHLRGISAIHVEYLKNMGVSATLTIGLVVDGKLWGMFSCHHMSPRVIGSETRIAAELFGQMISLLIKARNENDQAEARRRAADARQTLIAETAASADLLHAFPAIASIMTDLIDCDGISVLRDDKLQTGGSVPSAEAIHAIGERLSWDENLLLPTESLAADKWLPDTIDPSELNKTAGCLIVRATAAFPLQLMFFRDEVTRQVKWAGKPAKEYGEGEFGPRITPRGSFAAYMEEHRGMCKAWSPFDIAAAREVQIMLTQITAKGEREQLARHKDLISHQRQQDLMIAELNHRVKNILALIRSLSRQAKESSASLESYALALEQRIAALAAAHDLAVSESMQGVSLRGILETELSPYSTTGGGQVVLDGPVVGLRADVAPMIALVVHEVTSNAVKYGALSSSEGIVQVRWSLDEEGLTFKWRELGGPPVATPSRHGFGRSLIERAIPYEFDGTATLEYLEQGVRFEFVLPLENLVDLGEETSPKLATKISEIKHVASGCSALLVEDNIVLSMDMVECISRLGAEKIETAATLESGLAAINSQTFDFAVLDMNLRGSVSFDLALRLKEMDVPFLFVTGYGSKIDVPYELRDVVILTKPVDDGTLSRDISRILEARRADTP